MDIKQLKQLIANMPDDAEVLMFDRDTVNPVECIIPFNVTLPANAGVVAESTAYLDDALDDLVTPPPAALVFVCNL